VETFRFGFPQSLEKDVFVYSKILIFWLVQPYLVEHSRTLNATDNAPELSISLPKHKSKPYLILKCRN